MPYGFFCGVRATCVPTSWAAKANSPREHGETVKPNRQRRWLLQSFNLNNPAIGESVGNMLVVLDAFPFRKTPIFLRAGPGSHCIKTTALTGANGRGWFRTAGAGYEIPSTEKLGLAPIVDYAAGSLGDVRNTLAVETGRRYSAVEFKVAIPWHFGTPD